MRPQNNEEYPMEKYEFVAPFNRNDDYGDGPVVDFEYGATSEYVVWSQEAWEQMGKPQRVRVTITPEPQ